MTISSPPGLPAAVSSSRPTAPLSGRLRVPGDSQTGLCAMLLGALAVGESRIEGLPDDVAMLHAATALQALGASITRDDDGAWLVRGRGIGGLVEPSDVLDAGGSESLAALLAGVIATHPLHAVVTGNTRLRAHCFQPLLAALAESGARFQGRAGGLLPLTIEGARAALPLECELPARTGLTGAGLIKSAVLMAGLNARGDTLVREAEPSCGPETLLRHFGARISVEDEGAARAIRLQGQPELAAAVVRIPADPWQAMFPLLAALLVPGSRVVLEQVGINPLSQQLMGILRAMGADITVLDERNDGGEPAGDLLVLGSALRAIEGAPPPGTAAMLAVAAACAQGTSRLRGIGPGRAVADMLAANGVRVDCEARDLIVHGNPSGPSGGGVLACGTDPGLAMSALVLGLAAKQTVRIEDFSVIGRSFPDFAAQLNSLGAILK